MAPEGIHPERVVFEGDDPVRLGSDAAAALGHLVDR
jgi:hypothetical protein